MIWIYLILSIAITLLVMGLIFLKRKERYILSYLLLFIFPLMMLPLCLWNSHKTQTFQKTYVYLSNVKYSELDYNGREYYLQELMWYNRELRYAKENHASFWLKDFTSKDLLKYPEITLNSQNNED